MFVSGNNAIGDLYSKFDNIGDFTNKSKFRNPVKEQQKQQSQPIYIEKENPINFEKPKPKSSTSEYRKLYYQNVVKPKKENKKKLKKSMDNNNNNSTNSGAENTDFYIITEETFL